MIGGNGHVIQQAKALATVGESVMSTSGNIHGDAVL